MRRFLLTLALWLAFSAASAQDTLPARGSIRYFNSLKSGVLIGGYSPYSGTSSDFTVAASNGIRWRRLSASVELGVDRYSSWTVVPLGLGVSYDLIGKRNPVYISLSTSKPLVYNRPGEDRSPNSDYSASWAFNPAIGCRIKVDRASLYFQFGYKAQALTTSYWYDNGSGYRSSNSSTGEFRRFQAMIGFGLH